MQLSAYFVCWRFHKYFISNWVCSYFIKKNPLKSLDITVNWLGMEKSGLLPSGPNYGVHKVRRTNFIETDT